LFCSTLRWQPAPENRQADEQHRCSQNLFSEAVAAGDSEHSAEHHRTLPFATLVIEPGEHDGLARIVATQEDRLMLGSGDTAFASGIPDASIEKWNVFRRGKPLKDPETGEIIAYEAFFLGNASLVSPANRLFCA
jgi:hypothetical protein